jgi:hypothetical protein
VALRDGNLVSIEEVQSGLACRCVCPGCRKDLIAKKGQVRTHHFSHHESPDCGYSVETLAHLLVKEVLASTKTLTVPPVYPTTNAKCIYPYRDLWFEDIILENRLGDMVPDIIAYDASHNQLCIEVVVTNPPSQEKIQKLISRNTSAIEIIVPKCEVLTREAIKVALMSTAQEIQRWLFNRKAAQWRQEHNGPDSDGPNWFYECIPTRYAYFPTKPLSQEDVR